MRWRCSMAENTFLYNLRTKVYQMQSRNDEAYEDSNYSESYHEYLTDIKSEERKLKRLQKIQELGNKPEPKITQPIPDTEPDYNFREYLGAKKSYSFFLLQNRYLEDFRLPKKLEEYKCESYKWMLNKKNSLRSGVITFRLKELDEYVDTFSIWKFSSFVKRSYGQKDTRITNK
jgi:hypothetical protein